MKPHSNSLSSTGGNPGQLQFFDPVWTCQVQSSEGTKYLGMLPLISEELCELTSLYSAFSVWQLWKYYGRFRTLDKKKVSPVCRWMLAVWYCLGMCADDTGNNILLQVFSGGLSAGKWQSFYLGSLCKRGFFFLILKFCIWKELGLLAND